MNKNIIIIVLVILTLVLGVTALVNQIEAKKQREMSLIHAEEAKRYKKQAEECQLEAEKAFEISQMAVDSIMAGASREEK